jgi:hypothetical protein
LFSQEGKLASIPASGGPVTSLGINGLSPESSYSAANPGRIVFYSGQSIYTIEADESGLTLEFTASSDVGRGVAVRWQVPAAAVSVSFKR